jgi:hypothetical protein
MPRKPWEGREGYPIAQKACELFLKGHSYTEIADELTGEFAPETFTREDPYKIVMFAVREGWFTFHPPPSEVIAEQIRTRYPKLRVIVATPPSVSEVAYRAACQALNLMVERAHKEAEASRPPGRFSAAFGNGRTMQQVAEQLAHRLIQPVAFLPEALCFQAVSAGVDSSAAGSDASAFLASLKNPGIRQTHPRLSVEFDLLHAPPVVPPSQRLALINDIPAASDWQDPDSTLRKYLSLKYSAESGQVSIGTNPKLKATHDALEAEGVVGEMLFLPFNKSGPIDQSRHDFRAFSLLELEDLPKLIDRGTRVMLVIGPCASEGCAHPKTRVLQTILAMDPPWITDLIVDSFTASSLLKNVETESRKADA